MPRRFSLTLTCVLVLLMGSTFAQTSNLNRTLVVNGRPGQVSTVRINGREYVDLQAVAQIANGTLDFKGERITLTLPASESTNLDPGTTPEPEHLSQFGFSQEFMKAGIEAIALMREWGSPLAYAIQNGYPITEQWVANYREHAANGLRLASAAARSDAERNALQLLSNEFEGVQQWSNKLIEARKSMDTARYAISENALREDPLSQKLVSCGRFLGSMLGSGTFQDDPSCH